MSWTHVACVDHLWFLIIAFLLKKLVQEHEIKVPRNCKDSIATDLEQSRSNMLSNSAHAGNTYGRLYNV